MKSWLKRAERMVPAFYHAGRRAGIERGRQERAYENVGRLSQLSPGMIGYDGPDADRQALAAWLAVVGSEGGH